MKAKYIRYENLSVFTGEFNEAQAKELGLPDFYIEKCIKKFCKRNQIERSILYPTFRFKNQYHRMMHEAIQMCSDEIKKIGNDKKLSAKRWNEIAGKNARFDDTLFYIQFKNLCPLYSKFFKLYLKNTYTNLNINKK